MKLYQPPGRRNNEEKKEKVEMTSILPIQQNFITASARPTTVEKTNNEEITNSKTNVNNIKINSKPIRKGVENNRMNYIPPGRRAMTADVQKVEEETETFLPSKRGPQFNFDSLSLGTDSDVLVDIPIAKIPKISMPQKMNKNKSSVIIQNNVHDSIDSSSNMIDNTTVMVEANVILNSSNVLVQMTHENVKKENQKIKNVKKNSVLTKGNNNVYVTRGRRAMTSEVSEKVNEDIGENIGGNISININSITSSNHCSISNNNDNSSSNSSSSSNSNDIIENETVMLNSQKNQPETFANLLLQLTKENINNNLNNQKDNEKNNGRNNKKNENPIDQSDDKELSKQIDKQIHKKLDKQIEKESRIRIVSELPKGNYVPPARRAMMLEELRLDAEAERTGIPRILPVKVIPKIIHEKQDRSNTLIGPILTENFIKKCEGAPLMPFENLLRNNNSNNNSSSSYSSYNGEEGADDEDYYKKCSFVVKGLPPELPDYSKDKFLKQYTDLGAVVKWLSTSEAIIVFQSESIAKTALLIKKNSLIQIISLVELDKIEGEKFFTVSTEMYKIFRPERDSRVASRMISAALGVKLPKNLSEKPRTKSPKKEVVDVVKKVDAWED